MKNYEYQYLCKYLGNYDGDTIEVRLDYGFRHYEEVNVRLYGVDTPEIRKSKNVPDSEVGIFKASARMARDVVAEFMTKDKTYLLKSTEMDQYGRPVGDIINQAGESLCDFLLARKLAVAYDGKGSRSDPEFIELHRQNIQWLVENAGLTEDYGD